MDAGHDPIRHIGYLQQCLSSDKTPIGLFLGAGCPVAIKDAAGSPLIPDIAGITKAVRTALTASAACAPLLKQVDEHFDKDGRANVNIEELLSHVRSLRIVAGKDAVRGLSADQLDALDKAICEQIHVLADKELPSIDTPYHKLATWIGAITRDAPLEVFTTNYDLLLEQALEESRVPYFDGFCGGRKPVFDLQAMEEDAVPNRWVRLWKLHGSINWFHSKASDVFRTAHTATGAKRVIHPSHLKYDESRRMPYLAMIDRLRAFLKRPTACLVLCGYSFRDEHLNEVIIQGLQGTPKAIAFALMFNKSEDCSEAVALAKQRPNLKLLARDGAVISSRFDKWAERSKEAAESDPIEWVKWFPKEAAKPDGLHVASLELGDFKPFGLFLQELAGRARTDSGKPHAA